jgi:hypothetical protein
MVEPCLKISGQTIKTKSFEAAIYKTLSYFVFMFLYKGASHFVAREPWILKYLSVKCIKLTKIVQYVKSCKTTKVSKCLKTEPKILLYFDKVQYFSLQF